MTRPSTRLRQQSLAVLAIAGIALAVTPVAATAADDVSTGSWYIDAFNLRDAWNAGITGEGVVIAVIDSPINTEVPTLANANIEVREPSFCRDPDGGFYPATSTALDGPTEASHATGVASMIAGTGAGYPEQQGVLGVAPGAKVIHYTASVFYDETGEYDCFPELPISKDNNVTGDDAVVMAMNEAMDDGADIISVSLGVNGSLAGDEAIVRAAREGVIIVAATPNELLAANWPSSANGAVAVNAIDSSGQLMQNELGSNFQFATVLGPGVGLLFQGVEDTGSWTEQRLAQGTSFATPAVAGFLALVAQKYPDATANQLIQSLIRNTGAEDHELTYDEGELGYGIASATHMLRVDPTTYPDENPLITEDGFPTAEEIRQGLASTPSPVPEAPNVGDGSIPGWIIAAGVIVLIIVVLTIVLAIVFASRRARSTGPR